MNIWKRLINIFSKKQNTDNQMLGETELYAILEKSKTKTIKVEAVEEDNLPILSSKFLGVPYFPKDKIYPTDSENKPMILLAQINFEEVPFLDIEYPNNGILQFYISAYDDLNGLNFDNYCDQTNFRVIYHEFINEDKQQLELPIFEQKDLEYVPITKEHRLNYRIIEEYVPATDWRFELFFNKNFYNFWEDANNDTLIENYCDKITSSGHKIGGYAYFTQEDIRSKDEHSDYELLLQIDSNENDTIMWGDVGVANFFITKEALKNKDFSNVLYTWDCC